MCPTLLPLCRRTASESVRQRRECQRRQHWASLLRDRVQRPTWWNVKTIGVANATRLMNNVVLPAEVHAISAPAGPKGLQLPISPTVSGWTTACVSCVLVRRGTPIDLNGQEIHIQCRPRPRGRAHACKMPARPPKSEMHGTRARRSVGMAMRERTRESCINTPFAYHRLDRRNASILCIQRRNIQV